MNQEFPDDELQIEVRGCAGIITLNRPERLNALSLDMIRQMSSILHAWKDFKAVQVVIVRGAGDRAFCAGGDMRAVYASGMSYRRGQVSARVPALFFGEEYCLNRQIHYYPKPIVSIMNGITMGGGYGIAGHSRFRIATEKTVFAMPEVAIGFFTDVGSMVHLLRAPDHFGRYLALTGSRIYGSDMVHCGLADAFVQGSDIEQFIAELAQGGDPLSVVQSEAVAEPEEGLYCAARQECAAAFDVLDIFEIKRKLQHSQSLFALKAVQALNNASPMSVQVIAEYMRRAEGADFDKIIETDFTLAQNFINSEDIYEGVRARLLDKDRIPRWSPDSFEACSPTHIEDFFSPTGFTLADVQIFSD